jgi:hypothetical protein
MHYVLARNRLLICGTDTGISQSEKKLQTHTEASVKKCEPKISNLKNKYNKLCHAITALIQRKHAPHGAIAPECIPSDGLYKLNVDDTIWQDVGLDDDDGKDTIALPWLCKEDVRDGIRAVLLLDRTREEDIILEKERWSLWAWFTEEWEVLNAARADAGTFMLR